MVSGQQLRRLSILRRLGRMLQDRATPHSRVIIRHKVTTNIQPTQESRNYSQQGNSGQQNSNSAQNYQNSRDTRTPSNRDLHSQNSYGQSSAPGRSRADHLFITEILPTLSHSSRPLRNFWFPTCTAKCSEGYGQQNSYSQTSGYRTKL